MNCPICGEKLQLIRSAGDELFQFICTAETPSHYRTQRHSQLAEVERIEDALKPYRPRRNGT